MLNLIFVWLFNANALHVLSAVCVFVQETCHCKKSEIVAYFCDHGEDMRANIYPSLQFRRSDTYLLILSILICVRKRT